jgi:hypothetical protein
VAIAAQTQEPQDGRAEAMSTSKAKDDIVFEFEVGRRTIRASISHFRAKMRLDLREWYEAEPGEPLVPTRRGISVPSDYLGELEEAVAALASAVGKGNGTKAA